MVDVSKKKISEEQLKVLIDMEIEQSMGYYAEELAQERADAMDRYLGESIGTEMEGRSQVHSRDVLETIEWIMPTLVKIFTAQDRAVEFLPVGPEDEEQAEQEADYLNYLFYKKQDGFLILYSWFKDALMQKNGIVKTYVEDFEKVTKESYKGLFDIEWQALLSDEELEIDEETHEITQGIMPTPQGPVQTSVHSATFVRTEDDVRYCSEVVPPEEFLISKDARTVNPSDARFCAHVCTKTVSELREMGFSDEDLMQMDIGPSNVEYNDERLARMHLSDEERWDDSIELNTGMRQIRLYECYYYADMDGDGVAELLKVTRSGNFIDAEEIEYHPFDAITPLILTHKFYGLSIADLIKDIQEIRTMLFRGYMDNINQLINGRTFYDENTVNIDDMLVSKPYGVVGVDGNPNQSVLIDRPGGLPPEAYSLNELLDKFMHSRVGDFQTQLDPNVLAQANTGVVLEMMNETKAKVEMIARIFAEVGVKSLFRKYHHLVRTNSEKEDRFKLKNSWVPVDPREWNERTNLTVKVGLGTQNNQTELANLNAVFQNQLQLLQLGLPVVTPQNIYQTQVEIIEKMGYNADKYWTHPSQIPPAPPQPDPQQMLIQAQMKIEQDKNELKMQELALEQQRKAEELRIEEAKIMAQSQAGQDKTQLEVLKAELKRIESLSKTEQDNMALLLKQREMDLKEETAATKAQMDLVKTSTDQTLDKYKADLNAGIELLKADLATGLEADKRAEKLIVELMDSVEEMRKDKDAPAEIEYDDAGRITKVGNKRIVRDGSKPVRVE